MPGARPRTCSLRPSLAAASLIFVGRHRFCGVLSMRRSDKFCSGKFISAIWSDLGSHGAINNVAAVGHVEHFRKIFEVVHVVATCDRDFGREFANIEVGRHVIPFIPHKGHDVADKYESDGHWQGVGKAEGCEDRPVNQETAD